MSDNCPCCLQENVAPVAENSRGRQVSHLYQCPTCGHVWSTNRDLGAYEQDAA
ncbi:hypothetical protein [Streptomyces sp. NBC_01789]|uniref:hypothetical protein n=1 Tax=Streptomyces sp. NBC_01789 TaxID=2975941 RepID=UPI00224EBF45|nr:hypothetical protein [Streptomyces sp. NBC_01789]MCX4450642.1 hypothetical protein [Streptomyces sp. NBC_01789]